MVKWKIIRCTEMVMVETMSDSKYVIAVTFLAVTVLTLDRIICWVMQEWSRN